MLSIFSYSYRLLSSPGTRLIGYFHHLLNLLLDSTHWAI